METLVWNKRDKKCLRNLHKISVEKTGKAATITLRSKHGNTDRLEVNRGAKEVSAGWFGHRIRLSNERQEGPVSSTVHGIINIESGCIAIHSADWGSNRTDHLIFIPGRYAVEGEIKGFGDMVARSDAHLHEGKIVGVNC